jgi:anti-anti-sigma regulatory factor
METLTTEFPSGPATLGLEDGPEGWRTVRPIAPKTTDTRWVERFGSDLKHLAESRVGESFQVDFTGFKLLTSHLLAVLLRFHRLVTERGGKVLLVKLSAIQRDIFRSSRLDQSIPVEPER